MMTKLFGINYFFKQYYGNDVDDSCRNGQNIYVVKIKLRWRLFRSHERDISHCFMNPDGGI